MEQLFEFISQDQSISKIIDSIRGKRRQTLVYGVTGTQKALLLSAAYAAQPRPTFIATAGRDAVEQLKVDLKAFLPEVKVVELPPLDIITFTAAARSIELAALRLDILSQLIRGENIIVLASAEAVSQKVLSRQDFIHNRLMLKIGEIISRDDIIASLVKFGYERVDQVDSRGQISVRGGIIDIFPINRQLPARLELFGDEIDSLREFDPATQRSLGNLGQLDVLPLNEADHDGELNSVLTYLPAGAAVVFDEPARIREQISKLKKENPQIKNQFYDWGSIIGAAQDFTILYFALMLQRTPGAEPDEIIGINARSAPPFHRQMEIFTEELANWQKRGQHVVIFMSSKERAANLQKNLIAEGLRATFVDKIATLTPGNILIITGTINSGFELPVARLTILAEMDIFGRQKKRRLPRVAKDQQISYFRDINIGDYVVHVNHGIGKYTGVETLEVGGVHKDYFQVRYAGEDKLYVPTDQVHLLQKYIGSEGEVPRLSKMGGSDWYKVKARAKAAAADLAQDLLALYAARQLASRPPFEADTPWQKEFEEAFPFEETQDQISAIAEIKADMENNLPMDRLLCGDVGYGKTEVAIRAAFKAIMNGKQVAVLVPTTVLAQQHYQTFSNRFAGFAPVIDVISRFRSAGEQREIVKRLSAGQIDVLIGTHRILQSDVSFNNLGLLIIDEEQRFGVAQKERLKQLRTNIDILTLTATPIPRTLHMSLVGVRDMSIIETPPEDRLPVQSYVVEYHEEIIRDAIRRELKRGGQVYYVYNRVQTIDKIAERLGEILPDAKIKVAHGQMAEELLEKVMLDFYEGESDVLVCTSIIENGLDVPNANTIIVYDADRFGLSQLYQMRGRVGRSPRLAYAYFTYRPEKVLSEIAEKRLHAIKEFAELGAGFKIAMRDLEIRGAGNLLGAQQHGHIVSVGFEMYCRLLDEAVQELKQGFVVEPAPEPILEFSVDAYLDGDYIGDAMHKIEIYQRIAAIRKEEHIRDLLDELIDRFGDPTEPVQNLLAVAEIKNLARRLGIRSIIQRKETVEISFSDQPNIDVQKLVALKSRFPAQVRILPGPPEALQLRSLKTKQKLLEWLKSILGSLLRDGD